MRGKKCTLFQGCELDEQSLNIRNPFEINELKTNIKNNSNGAMFAL